MYYRLNQLIFKYTVSRFAYFGTLLAIVGPTPGNILTVKYILMYVECQIFNVRYFKKNFVQIYLSLILLTYYN
jgi:hypothetical protein